MICISLYFDEQTNERFSRLSKKIQEFTNVSYEIPYHITLCAGYQNLKLDSVFSSFDIEFVSLGILNNSICVFPIIDASLYNAYKVAQDTIDEQNCNRYYPKGKIFSHVTLCKHLTSKQLSNVFLAIQNNFKPFKGKVVRCSITQTNPYQELNIYKLKEGD